MSETAEKQMANNGLERILFMPVICDLAFDRFVITWGVSVLFYLNNIKTLIK